MASWELYQRRSGATEHMDISGATGHRADRWLGALATANIGLAGSAFTGAKWQNKHKPQLSRQFHELLSMPGVQGLCLCEVGNISDPITADGKQRLTEVLQSTFASTFQGAPQIIWPTTESSTTCAAWTGDVRVDSLPSFRIPTLPSWRTIERMRVKSAPEHGEQVLMVYISRATSPNCKWEKPEYASARLNIWAAANSLSIAQAGVMTAPFRLQLLLGTR